MEKERFELTNPQKSIWLTGQMYQDMPIENICGSVYIETKIDFDALENAINMFIEKNDSFRIKLTNDGGQIRQYISDFVPTRVERIDLAKDEDVCNIEKELVSKVFPLIDTLLFEFKMFKLPNGQGGFTVVTHHLIADAWSSGIGASEIVDFYAELTNAKPCEEKEMPSYIEYIHTEKEYLNSERFIKDKEYWESLFQSIPEIAKIPAVNEEVTNKLECKAKRKQFNISGSVIEEINKFCTEKRVSIFNFFMATFAIYLGKVSSLKEFVIGTPILNRKTFREKHTTGMFISTVPFKISLEDNLEFASFVSTIAKDSLSMLRHQKYPYQYLLEDLRKRNSSIPNLYDILISYQNVRTEKQTSEVIPFKVKWIPNDCLSDGMNIHIYDMNDTGNLDVAYDYLISRYDENTIDEIHKRILYIIEQILKNNKIELNKIEIITPEEKKKLCIEFNNTEFEYDKTKTVAELFEEQVQKTPEAVALVFEKKVMTYEELNERANSLAYYLREKGVTRNTIVGIMVNRSFEMIIAILAVLKSGGAYIPIDPEYPLERVSYMLENSKSKFLLSTKSLNEKHNFEQEIIEIDLDSELYNNPKENLKHITKPDDLSYLIYTSGSTGTPKGVMLTQKNLCNFCKSMYNKIEYLKADKQYSIVSVTTVSFDIFVFETIVSLTRGLKLFMTNYFEQKITTKLERLIKDNKIDIIQTTPSTMKFHLDNLSINSSLSDLKYVMLAGEQLPKSLVERIKNIAPKSTIYNGYGPSETTIFSTVCNVTDLDVITIGKPIGNTQIYILGKEKTIMPMQTPGEIYIAGDGVGLGYKGNNNLTEKGFLENPFTNNSKLYKTGDLGVWLPDGTIKCLGRVDNQIKLRGLRIEIGEIEEIINSYDREKKLKSAVILKNENGNVSLHAFFNTPKEVDIAELKKFIKSYLPNYMIPNTFTYIENIPYTPNGKIDRKALQNVKIDTQIIEDNELNLPRNELDEIIYKVVKEKLNIEKFGIDQNIFEYGADSLIVINILTELFQYDLGLKVGDFYQFPTVRQLSDHISSKGYLGKNIDEKTLNSVNNIVKKLNTETNAHKNSDKKSLLITGCTGFLGAHLLARILKSPENVDNVYCLVRGKNNEEPRKRLYDTMFFYFGNEYDALLEKMVTVIEADISKEDLGMHPVAFKLLKENVNTVIHSAANVKHYGNYADFEKANIIGTKNIISFCKIASAELHYISTMTISANYLIEQENNNIVFTESSFFENQNFDENVYAKSKLLAEESVLSEIPNGLNATIYRIGDLSGRYSDGVFQKNIEENSIYLRLKSILEIGAISDALKDLELEFTPVDEAADSIIKIIWSDIAKNRIFHIYNQNKITTNDLIYMLQDYKEIKYMNQKDFAKYVKQLSTNQATKKSIKGIINDFTNETDLIYNHTIPVSNRITCDYLKNLSFEWSALTKEYFNKLIEYMKKVNFIS